MAERNQGGVAERNRGQEAGGRRQESEGVFGAVSDAAKTAASSVESVAEKAWDKTTEGAQQAACAVAHTAEDAWESTRGFMGRYPIATFFAGVGVGALFVLAMQRRYD